VSGAQQAPTSPAQSDNGSTPQLGSLAVQALASAAGTRSESPDQHGAQQGNQPVADPQAGNALAASGAVATPAAVPVSAVTTPSVTTPSGLAGSSQPDVPQPLHQQLAAPVLALRAGGDGTHRVIISLHPDDLGPVNVEVRIRGGAMSVALASSSDATRETLRASLGELHTELNNAGLTDVALSLDTNAANSFAGQHRSQAQQAAGGGPGHQAASHHERDSEPASHSMARLSTSASGVDRWL
jgi:flagellar hook-length control protein FliK